jgi:hypothetical protein
VSDLDYPAMHADLTAAADVLERTWQATDGPWIAHLSPSETKPSLWCGGPEEAEALRIIDTGQGEHLPLPGMPFAGDAETSGNVEWIALASLFGPLLPTMLREVANHIRFHRPEPLASRDAALIDLARQVLTADRRLHGAVQ